MTAIRLSICIPTYNFGEFIGQTLESILPQVVEGVEVVILDGGSTDDTTAVVERFQERYPALRYVRQDERGGIDRDMARTVELARGEYCWLFSSDDLMPPGAMAAMLAEIDSGYDVYLCGLTICTFDMHPVKEHKILRSGAGSTFDLADEHDRRAYFERADTTTAFFSFLGSVIFRKARWDEVPLNEDFVGSCWAHAARLFELVPSGLTVKYLRTSYVLKRSDNDSFMEVGIVRRYAISIDGYHRIASTFFGAGSVEAWHIRRVVTNEFHLVAMLWAKMLTRDAPPEDRAELARLAAKNYGDPTLRNRVKRVLYRLTPLLLFKILAEPYIALMKALKRR